MVSAEILSDKEGIDKVNKIYQDVFNKEDTAEEETLYNVDNRQLYHALVYEGLAKEEPVAAGRLVIDNDMATLDWIAVKEEHRRKHYGDMIARMLVEKVKSISCFDIHIDVPSNLERMFQNIGFLPVEEKLSANNDTNIQKNRIKMKYNKNHLNSCQRKQNNLV